MRHLASWILGKRWRIVAAGVLMVALPLLALAFSVSLHVAELIRGLVIEEGNSITTLAAHTLEERLKYCLDMTATFAKRPLLQTAIHRDEAANIRVHLKHLVETGSTIERAFVATPKGVLFADYPVDPAVYNVDFSSRDWYRGVSRAWRPYISEFYLRQAAPQRYLFAVAVPVKDNASGEVIAILVAQPSKTFISSALESVKILDGHVYVVDKKGRLIYHSDVDTDREVDYSGALPVQSLKLGREGAVRALGSLHKVPVVAMFHPISAIGWGVVVERHESSLFSPVRLLMVWISLFTVVFLGIGSFFAYRGAGLLATTDALAKKLGTMTEEQRTMNEEYQRLNAELQSRERLLRETNLKLEKASRAKSDFLANMSHELRTPLNSIIGFADILGQGLQGELTGEQAESVRDISGSGRHLLSLINDILDLSKVEAGKMELEPEELDIGELALNSLTFFREKALKHRLALCAEIADGTGTIVADVRKVKQVIINLLSNAVKFTPDGGSIRVRTRRVAAPGAVTCDTGLASGEFVEIAVEDTGIGISPEDQQQLFQPFEQVQTALTREFIGTGLGLSLCRNLVKLHGGTIWVESEPGRGSTFTFTLPVEQPAKRKAPFRPSAAAIPVALKSVVVIEDDAVTIRTIEAALRNVVCAVHTAPDGESGLALARKEHPDLVVLDLGLPGMSGLDVARALKADPASAAIPIVVLTAMDLPPDDRSRLLAQVEAVLQKGDLSGAQFIEALRQVAGKSVRRLSLEADRHQGVPEGASGPA